MDIQKLKQKVADMQKRAINPEEFKKALDTTKKNNIQIPSSIKRLLERKLNKTE